MQNTTGYKKLRTERGRAKELVAISTAIPHISLNDNR